MKAPTSDIANALVTKGIYDSRDADYKVFIFVNAMR
jgi:hypothetical protein